MCTERKNSDSSSDNHTSCDESDCIGHSSSSSISSTEISHDELLVDISNTDEPPNEIKFDIGKFSKCWTKYFFNYQRNN